MPVFALGDGRELRPLRESDADELHALIERNRPRLAQWMQWAGERSQAQTLTFIRTTRAQLQSGGGFQGAITHDGHIVGVAGMHEIDRANSSVQIGYWLDAEALGAGVMTGAVAALVQHAFADLHLHRVEIRAAVHNERSRALIERLGFAYEGILRESYRVGSEYHDDAVYAMLAAEWPACARQGAASQRLG